MKRRNVTFEWLEGKAAGELGSIVSIDVNHERRLLSVCYEDGEDGNPKHEGASPRSEFDLTSNDI